MPVAMAALSKEHNVFTVSDTVFVVPNPDGGIDVCPRFSVLCYLV
jgi:hypothetical protein